MRAVGLAVTAVAAIAVSAGTVVACSSPKPPDFQSVWTTSPTTGSATTTPTEPPVPLSKYLEKIGVIGSPVAPSELTDLTVSIPTPPGWRPRGDPSAASKAVVIAKGDSYPAAILVVLRLRGEFNPAEAIKHANNDLPEGFHQLNASVADFNGFPSSMVEGSYELKGARMHSYNRVVIASGSAPGNERYFVQLIINSFAAQTVADSSDVEGIIRGFVVAKK